MLTRERTIASPELRQIDAALRGREVVSHLLAAVNRGLRSTGEDASRARCRVLDVKYQPGERCVILYEVGERLVVGTLACSQSSLGSGEGGMHVTPMGLDLYPFPFDPAMPGLPAATGGESMAQTLTGALPECQAGGWRVAQCSVALIRYRPLRRCTLRIHVRLRHQVTGAFRSRTLIGKVYQTRDKAEQTFRQTELLPGRLAPRPGPVVVSAPVAFLPEVPMVLQEVLPGLPLDLLLRSKRSGAIDARAASAVERVATAMAQIHGSGLEHPRQRSVAAELDRLCRRGQSIATVDTVLGSSMARLCHLLHRNLGSMEQVEMTMIHGDCKPSQFLIDGSRVGVLDFDHAGMADPAYDVGAFLASLRQENRRRTIGPPEGNPGMLRLEGLFLDGYRAAAGADALLERRAAWYQAFALLRKAQRAFGRSIRSPLPARFLTEAGRCLAAASADGATR